ncbi:unnamed protein product [Rhizophagus irregularis]|uniref:Uncharacterized protein n=1 Tax=Rhizophagus irregularis TaxID=588596 RepID=A0A916EJE9_9GLOM|nr:unnamed protein product [Rhizophagus irregularis]CAB5197308.1 unnamed protein product [Rhizophagus irregularis]CAB5395597.1 unnamed protein product [Rhizophagus irregularis]
MDFKNRLYSAPKYNGHPCCGKPELSVMLYGDTALTVLREKNLKYGYGRHKNFHLNMYTKNGMLDASNFYYDYKDIILDGPTDNENIGIKESYYFGGSKRKIVYLKETKPIIITTEEAIILEEAITKERCNNDRTEAITQERSPPVVPGYPVPYSH